MAKKPTWEAFNAWMEDMLLARIILCVLCAFLGYALMEMLHFFIVALARLSYWMFG